MIMPFIQQALAGTFETDELSFQDYKDLSCLFAGPGLFEITYFLAIVALGLSVIILTVHQSSHRLRWPSMIAILIGIIAQVATFTIGATPSLCSSIDPVLNWISYNTWVGALALLLGGILVLILGIQMHKRTIIILSLLTGLLAAFQAAFILIIS